MSKRSSTGSLAREGAKTVVKAAELTPFPYVNALASSILKIIEQIEKKQRNDEDIVLLGERVRRAKEILKHHQPDEKLYSSAYQTYRETMEKVYTYVKKIKDQPDKSTKTKYLKSIFRADDISEANARLTDEFEQALRNFHLDFSMDTNKVVRDINQKVDNFIEIASSTSRLPEINPNEIKDPEEGDEEVRGRKGTIRKKYYSGEVVAFRDCGQTPDDKNDLREIEKSAVYLHCLSACESIIRFKGMSKLNGHIYTVTGWAEKGSLESYLRDDVKTEIPWILRIKFAKQIASALQFCHKNNILHHNIRSKNVLLDSDLNAKLANFDYSRKIEYLSVGVKRKAEENRWFPPERFGIDDHKFCVKCEMYSFSVLLWEIASRKLPYDDDVKADQELTVLPRLIQSGKIPGPMDSDTPQKFIEIIMSCRNLNPNDRPGTEKVCEELQNLYAGRPKVQQYLDVTPNISRAASPLSFNGPSITWEEVDHLHCKKEYNKAYDHVIRFANDGNEDALIIAGKYLSEKKYSEFFECNEKRALTYFTKAAEQGNIEARYYCAKLCLKGRTPDTAKGIENLQLAAKSRHTDALLLLAEILYGGKHGQAKNLEKSLELYDAYLDKLDDNDDKDEIDKIKLRIAEIEALKRKA